MSTRAARTAALFGLAVDLPAAVLVGCLGITSVVAWQRARSRLGQLRCPDQ
jgi:hypothetical protein